MSTTIDQKVVEMRFDNAQFEKGISTSMSSLDKLKSSLSFDNLSASSASNLGKIGDNLQSLANRFSFVGEKVRELENQVFGLVKSLSLDQIMAGFSKYTDMTKSVQTIMAATRQEWSDTGAQMSYVSDQLERLNWFTDETSYDFVDMTGNIGKFTSAGIDLEQATTAMQGIATWAGISGAGVQEASRAMYNLSQSMAMGGVQLRDWMSIENANMATQEFKQTAIDTAVAMGILERGEDGVARTTDGLEVTVTNFRNTLNQDYGMWFDNNVLTETLNKYGSFADKMHDATEATGLTATDMMQYVAQYKDQAKLLGEYTEKTGLSVDQLRHYITNYKAGNLDMAEVSRLTGMSIGEVAQTFSQLSSQYVNFTDVANDAGVSATLLVGWLSKLSDEYYDLGYAAFKASQESKTFEDSMLATKDAVSSAWMNLFITIMGDYLQSKELWTAVTNELYDLFVENVYNAGLVAKAWGELGGREHLFEGIKNIWGNIRDIIFAVQDGFRNIFPPATAEELYDLTVKFENFTKSIRFSEEDIEKFTTIFSNVFNVVKNIFDNIITVLRSIGSAFSEVFDPVSLDTVEDITKRISDLSDKLRISDETADKLKRTFKGVFAVIDILKNIIVAILEPIFGLSDNFNGLGDGVLGVTANIGDAIVGFDEWAKSTDVFREIVGKVVDFISKIPGKLNELSMALFGMSLDELFEKIKTAVLNAWEAVKTFFQNIPTYAEKVTQALFGMSLEEFFDTVKKKASEAWEGIKEFFSGIRDNFKKIFGSSGDTETGEESFTSFADTVTEKTDGIKSAWEKIKPYIDQFFDAFKQNTDFEFPSMEEFGDTLAKGTPLAAIAAITAIVLKFFGVINKVVKDKDKIVDALTGMFNSIGGFFDGLKKKVQVETVKTIATAILELAAAIFLIAMIRSDKLALATVVIAGLMYELKVIMESFDKMTVDSKKFKTIRKVLGDMMVIIAEIAAAIILIAREDINSVTVAAAALVILLGEVALIVAAFGKLDGLDEGQMTKAAGAAMMMGVVLIEISVALAIVGNLPVEGIAAGAIALSAVLAVLTICIAALGEAQGNFAKGAAASLLMGIALVEIAVALAILGNIQPENLLAGALALSGVLAVMTIALMALGEAQGNIVKGAASLTLASVGLILIAGALAIVASVAEGGHMVETLILLAGALALVLVAAIPAQYLSVGLLALGTAIALIGVGALAAGTGLWLFADAVEKLVAAGPGAVEVMIDALASFFLMVPTMATKVGEAIVAFIRVFIDSSDTILEGIVTLITIILESINQTLPKLMETIGNFIVSLLDLLIKLIPKIMEFLGVLLTNVLKFIVDHTPELVDALIAFTKEALRGLLTITNDITATALQLIMDTLTMLAENIAPITAKLVEILIGTITGTFDGLTASLPQLMESVWNFVITMIESFADGLDAHAQQLRDAIDHLCVSIWEAIKTFFGIHSPSTKFSELAHNMIQGMINGLGEMIGKAKEKITELADKVLTKICDFFGVDKPTNMSELGKMGHDIIQNMIDGISNMIGKAKEKITELADKVLTAICNFFGVDKPESANEFLNLGKTIIQKFNAGIYGMIEKAKSMVTDFAKRVLDAVCKFFGVETPGSVGELYSIAKDLINGFIEGIYDKVNDAIYAVGEFCDDVVQKCKNVFGVASPSKVFMEIGRYVDEGLAVGIDKYSQTAIDATEDMGNNAINSIADVLSNISDYVNDEMDADPTIRPVLDLSNITDGAQTINDLLSGDRAMSMAASSNMSMNASLANQTTTQMMLAELRDALSGFGENNESIVNNNTFNISGSNPKEIADEINKILQEQMVREDSVWA